MRFITFTLATLLITASLTFAQNTATPATPATPPAPSSPLNGIRNKISAGDLLSAESMLEVHRVKNGEDSTWLAGLSWLARGALLVGDIEKAERYVVQVRKNCADWMARGVALEKQHDLEYAYGTAIETEAQLIERSKGVQQAVEYVRDELTKVKGPPSLISRLNKRINILTLTGKPAPELEIEDFLYDKPPTLASLRGKPVLLFIWAFGCGDCKAQEPTFAKVKSRYTDRGLQVVMLTRYYDPDSLRARERFQMDSVWKAVYADIGTVPIVISTASMERYGGSSTPTFVFIDRDGIVRRYTPTRLTEEEFERTLEQLMR
jgi:cytochrome c biogenesis protein CcmG/thiol:disulfide interchange protein DsbE